MLSEAIAYVFSGVAKLCRMKIPAGICCGVRAVLPMPQKNAVSSCSENIPLKDYLQPA